jgi:hypothetical protein
MKYSMLTELALVLVFVPSEVDSRTIQNVCFWIAGEECSSPPVCTSTSHDTALHIPQRSGDACSITLWAVDEILGLPLFKECSGTMDSSRPFDQVPLA